MDFHQAITAHASWKKKLSAYVQKPDGTLKPADVALDNKCDLGKWIAGEAVKFSSLPEFSSLQAEHARFHKAAAELVRRADTGEKVTDEMAIGANNEFRHATTAVVRAIVAMKSLFQADGLLQRQTLGGTAYHEGVVPRN